MGLRTLGNLLKKKSVISEPLSLRDCRKIILERGRLYLVPKKTHPNESGLCLYEVRINDSGHCQMWWNGEFHLEPDLTLCLSFSSYYDFYDNYWIARGKLQQFRLDKLKKA